MQSLHPLTPSQLSEFLLHVATVRPVFIWGAPGIGKSALVNRMVHVQLCVSASEWLAWAQAEGLHPLVIEYLQQRPDHLWSPPPKHEEPFSSPRAWTGGGARPGRRGPAVGHRLAAERARLSRRRANPGDHRRCL